MEIDRRAFLRLGAGAGAACVGAGHSMAAGNSADLAPGSFIWQPRLAPKGPLLVALSGQEGLVRVSRAGLEIGIATCTPVAALTTSQWGVFAIDGGHDGAGDRLSLRGSAVVLDRSRRAARSAPIAVLPKDFAALLAAEMSHGAVLVVGGAVSRGTVVGGAFLLPEGVSLVSTQTLAARRPARAGADVIDDPPAHLVVSTRDGTALLRRPDGVEVTGTIAVRGDARPEGTYVLSLTTMGSSADASRWLALDLAASADTASAAFGRISLHSGHLTPLVLAAALRPGSTMVLTDEPLSSDREAHAGVLLGTQVPRAGRPLRRASAPRRPRVTSATSEFALPKPLKFFREY